jgi:outer membrane protein assembly factor BamB
MSTPAGQSRDPATAIPMPSGAATSTELLTEVWRRELDGQVRATPLIVSPAPGIARIIVGTLDGDLLALDGRDGRTIWSHRCAGPLFAPAAAADIDADGELEIVVGSGGGSVEAIRARDGISLWRHARGRPVRVKPALLPRLGSDGHDVVAADDSNTVFRLDGRTGVPLWQTALPCCPLTPFVRGIVSSPLAADVDDDGRLEIVVGTRAKRIFCLDSGTGGIVWQRRIRYGSDSSPVAFHTPDGPAIAIGSGETLDGEGDRSLYVLGGATGRPRLRLETAGGIDGASVVRPLAPGKDDAIVFASLADASLRAVRAADGASLWRYRFGPTERCRHDDRNVCVPRDRSGYDTASVVCGSYATPLVADLDGDGRLEVVAGCNNGTLVVLDGLTGALRSRYQLEGPIRPSPVMTDLDGDGRSEVFVLAGRTLRAFRVPALCPAWSQYKGDALNSGGTPLPRVTQPGRGRPPGGSRFARTGAIISCWTLDAWEYLLYKIEKHLMRPWGRRIRPFYY